MTQLVSRQELKGCKRLLFMTHLALGDFVYHAPLLKALKSAYPNLEIDIWMDDCRERSKEWRQGRSDTLESWISNTGIAEVIFPIASKNSDRDTLVRRAGRRNYDIIFYLVSTRVERFAQVAYAISKKALIVGNAPNGYLRKLKSINVMRRVKRRFDTHLHQENTHISERYKRYYEVCFGTLTLASEDQYGVAIKLPEASLLQARQWREQQDGFQHKPFIMINPISTSTKRDLNGDTLTYLIQALIETYPNIHIVLNVPPSSEIGMSALLKNQNLPLSDDNKISIFSAKTDFFALPAMMQQCDYVITVETSVMHIAASMGIRQLAIIRKSASKWQPLRTKDIFWCEGNISDCDERSLTAKALACINECLNEKTGLN